MAERIGSAELYVGIRDEEAIAGLRKVDAAFERTMDKIDRKEAEAKIGANTRDLDRAVKKAQAELDALEKRKVVVKGTSAEKEIQKEIDARRENIKAIEDTAKAEKKNLDQRKKDNKEADYTAQRVETIRKREEQLDKLRQQAHNRRMQQVSAEARASRARENQRLRELSADERHARQMEKERNEVPKLEREYIKLHDRLEKLAVAKRKTRGNEHATLIIDVEEREALSRIDHLRKEIRSRVGRDPIAIPIRPDTGRKFGQYLRHQMILSGGNATQTAARVGADLGGHLGNGFKRRMGNVMGRTLDDNLNIMRSRGRGALSGLGRTVGGGLVSGLARIGHAAAGLSEMTVRLGPFTTTIRKAITGMSLLAPSILDVVGALAALGGSVGAATLGVGALGSAVVGGGVPALLGFGLVIKGVQNDLSNINKAQKAYDDAVRKGNTDLAAKKMAELKATMGNVSKETVKTFLSWKNLKKEWSDRTTGARGNVFRTMADGVKTARDLMPDFAHRTNQGMLIATRAVRGWMGALRSPQGRLALDEMMTNFNGALGPVLRGLGSLMGYLGRVGQIASRSLPGLGRQFEAWAKGINSVETSTLEGKVGRVMGSMRKLGALLMSGARLIKAFFGSGVKAGDDLTVHMTKAMDKWTAFLNSTSGKRKMGNFFQESTDGARSLWNVLQPVVASFVRWAANIAPFARAFLDGAAAIGNFVSELLRLTGLNGAVAALATTLGVLWGIGKIRGAVTAVTNFVTSLLGIERANARVAASSNIAAAAMEREALAARGAGAAGTASGIQKAAQARSTMPVGIPTGAAKAEQAAARAGQTASRAARGFSMFKGAAGGAITALTGLSPVAGGALLAVGALTFGVLALANRERSWESANKDTVKSIKNWHASLEAMPAAHAAVAGAVLQEQQAQSGVKNAQKEVNRLRKAGKTGTDEYKMAVNNLRQAQLSEYTSKQQVIAATKQESKTIREASKAARERVQSSQKAIDKHAGRGGAEGDVLKTYNELLDKGMTKEKARQALIQRFRGNPAYKDDLKSALGYIDKNIRAQAMLKRQQDLAALASLNQQRAARGLVPIAQSAAAAFGQLKRAMPNTAKTIALKFTGAGEASKVAKSAARSLSSGVPKKLVSKIVVDAKSANQAIRQLNHQTLKTKIQHIREDGGAGVMRALKQIYGTKLATKVQHILANKKDADSKIKSLIALGIPRKTAIMLGNNADALRKARQANAQRLRTLTQAIARVIHNPGNLFSNLSPIQQTVVRTIKKLGAAEGGMFASGGTPGFQKRGRLSTNDSAARPDLRQQERANTTAALSGSPRPMVSQKLTSPRFLVKEEATPEYVVSTNPKYRKRNKFFAAQAARAVGLNVQDPSNPGARITMADGGLSYMNGGNTIAAAVGTGPVGGSKPGSTGKFYANLLPPDFTGPRSKTKKPLSKKQISRTTGTRSRGIKKSGKLAHIKGNPWAAKLSSLLTRQEDMEREASIRESQVREPEDFVTETYDAQGNISHYAFDSGAFESYKGDLSAVIQVYTSLQKVVQEITEVARQAQAYAVWEIQQHKINVSVLNKEIKRLHGVKGKAAKKKASTRLDKLGPRLDAEKQSIKDITGYQTELTGARKEAGFDLREYGIKIADLQGEVSDSAQAKIKESIGRDNAGLTAGGGGGDGGGGGADTGGLTYGAQQSAASAEKANILREFGSNFSPNVGGTAGASSPGASQGMRGNVGDMLGQIGAPNPFTAGASAAGAFLGATSGAAASGASAVSAFAAKTASPTVVGSTGIAATGGGDTNVVVNNTFANVPPDPHTWSKGVEFEIGALL